MAVKKGPIHQESLRGGSILKTGIFGNCVFATFSKNIKHLTFAGCQSEIPLNSSQLLSIPYESEVLLPICYQIFDDVLGRCQGVFYKKRVWHLMEYLGRNETNYLCIGALGGDYWGAMVRTYGTVWLIGADTQLYGHLNICLVRVCSDFSCRQLNDYPSYFTNKFIFLLLILFFS